MLAALRRYRDAQERGLHVAARASSCSTRLSLQWFRARVLARGVATLADGQRRPAHLPPGVEGLRVADGARADLLRGNLRLVVGLARAYRSRAVELLDLVQEGNIGLMRAIDRFDYRRGYRLATYATWWIRNAVSRAVAETPRTIRVPANMRRAVRRVAHARAG